MGNRLPKSWRNVTIENLIIPQKGKKPKKLSKSKFRDAIPYLDIKAIEKDIVTNYADMNSSVIANNKDVLIVWDGARSGWVGTSVNGAVGSTLMRLTPILTDSKYIFYFLKSKFDFLNTQTKGIGIPHINQDIFWSIKIPLAPVQEQKRISKKLDKMFKNIYSIQSRLDEFPNIISDLRQQILKLAFSGQLTGNWRKSNKINKQWPLEKLLDHSIKIGSGATPTGGKSSYSKTGIPLIRSMNVHFNGFKYDGLAFINKKQASQLDNVIVKRGDVLLNITGASIGRVCQAPPKLDGARVNQHVCIIRTKPSIDQNYLRYFIASPQMQFFINTENYGVTRPALTKQMIENFEIPLPIIDEQREIVKRVDSLFKRIEKIDNKYRQVVENFNKIPNSILDKAYSGKLIPQNLKDEPVEKLLERIQKEKEKLEQQKKESKKKSFRTKRKKEAQIMEIIELLKKNKRMKAEDVWKQSDYSDDIDKFYAELKKLIDIEKKVKDIKKGLNVYLELTK